MSKKIILGLFGLVVVGSAAAMGTRAYFSEKGEVKGNVFETGTLALKLDGSESVTAVWKIETGKPGDEVSGTVNVKNAGTVEADHIEITTLNAVTEATSGSGTEAKIPLDTVLEITTLTYDGASVLGQVEDKNGNNIKDLDDLEKVELDNLALMDTGVDHPLAMTVSFNPVLTIGEHQGDSATTTLTVTLNQVAAQ